MSGQGPDDQKESSESSLSSPRPQSGEGHTDPSTSPSHTTKPKIDILLKATGDAPIMKRRKWAVERTKKIAWVSEFIKKYIKSEASESLFLYVNQSFSPSPDTEVGTVFDCFGSDGKLVLHYCKTQAWG